MESQQDTFGLPEDPLAQVMEVLAQVRQFINNKLAELPELVQVRIRLDNDFGKMIGFLAGTTGVGAEVHSGGIIDQLFKYDQPVTRMFGEDINRPQPVTDRDLTPTDGEKAEYQKRRDDLYERFADMSDDQLSAMLKTPDGVRTIRGVGKKAGLDNFKDRPVNVKYFEDVRALILEKRSVMTADQIAQQGAQLLQQAADGTLGGSLEGIALPASIINGLPVTDPAAADPGTIAAGIGPDDQPLGNNSPLLGDHDLDNGEDDEDDEDLGAQAPPPPIPDAEEVTPGATVPPTKPAPAATNKPAAKGKANAKTPPAE